MSTSKAWTVPVLFIYALGAWYAIVAFSKSEYTVIQIAAVALLVFSLYVIARTFHWLWQERRD
jgi:hypothetical protein